MPTLNPRVNVTLSPSLHALVDRLARLQRASKAQVLRELLEAAEPALQRVALLMETAEKATAEVRHGLRRSLDRAQDKLERNASVALATLESTTDDLVAQAEAVRARRPVRGAARRSAPASAGVQDPPASNRGVKSGPKRVSGAPRVPRKGARS